MIKTASGQYVVTYLRHQMFITLVDIWRFIHIQLKVCDLNVYYKKKNFGFHWCRRAIDNRETVSIVPIIMEVNRKLFFPDESFK